MRRAWGWIGTLMMLVAGAAAPARVVTVVISPNTSTVTVGQDVDVLVEAQAGTQQADGVAAYINFDTTALQVVSVTGGSVLTMELQRGYDNALGRVNYAAGTVSNCPSGTFTLVTIRFHAVAATAGTALTFNAVVPRKTDATFMEGRSVLTAVSGGTVVVKAATPAYCTCAGDADCSLFVNFTDYVAVRTNFGRSPDPITGAGDADCNGFINFNDYVAVRSQFGRTCPSN